MRLSLESVGRKRPGDKAILLFLNALTQGGYKMKQSLSTLRKQAEEAAKFRRHTLQWSSPHHEESRSIQDAICTRCPAWVQIDSDPPPNGIDIGGPAFALSCPADCESIC